MSHPHFLSLFLCLLSFTASAATPPERFDASVRDDFFSGLAGRPDAFERAMATCERMLAKNPRHPEALVWHGSGCCSGRKALRQGRA